MVKYKKKYNKKTPEERRVEIENLSKKAFSRIEKYTQSTEDLIEYANYLAMFHSYSANNMALIYEQFGNSLTVASFKDWKDKGYNVNKGEKGIEILSYTPITYFKNSENKTKQVSEATDEEKKRIKSGELDTWKMNAYKIGHVFDVSQTNCPVEDLPKAFPNKQFNFKIENGNNADYLKKGIKKLSESLGIEIKDMKDSELGLRELGLSKGVYAESLYGGREILLNSRNTETQSIATSIHELVHAKLHSSGEKGSKFDSATKEFQAELTSYIVCKHFGMDTSEKAIPYIAGWTSNGENIEEKSRAFEEVHTISKEFIDIMDEVISQEKELGNDLEVDGEIYTSLNRNNQQEVDRRSIFKENLVGLLKEHEMMAQGDPEEIIYQIDEVNVYGGFDYGVRGVSHNILVGESVTWEDVIEWGVVVVPENKTYISDFSIAEFKNLGYSNLSENSNHIVGFKEIDDIENIEVGMPKEFCSRGLER